MAKDKNKRFVFSVYSRELEDYPYFPFIGKTISEGVTRYLDFLSNRPGVCPLPELHLIGTCRVIFDVIQDIQPYLFPKRVDFETKLLWKLKVLSSHYFEKISDYLSRYMLKGYKEKCHNQKKLKN